jgi:ABC-2 type transport system ATP-binding protein
MTTPIINVSEVKKHFKAVKAVDGIDLQIRKGEYVALLGPNGAGKTTLVEMIEGIQHPDSGTIAIKDKSWKQHAADLHRIIGLSLQETRFIEKISVIETLNLFASFYDLGKDRVEEVLALVSLQEKRKARVDKLSGGQRQRLALSIALLNKPEILLLDEPTTGLDPTARREIWDILMQLKNQNTTMILTTHYMEEASFLCDRIVMMDKGKILAQGTLSELLSAHKEGEVITYTLDKPLENFPLPHPESILQSKYEKATGEGEVIVKDIVHFLPDFLETVRTKNINLKSLECRKMTLDDLFISMTGRRFDD